jgi:hypothetical protein
VQQAEFCNADELFILIIIFQAVANTANVQNGTVSLGVLFYCGRMKSGKLTAKQLSSVSCPTCGVAAGNRCVLHSGTPRSGPHVDRKFCAIDALERTDPHWHRFRQFRLPAGIGSSSRG